MKLKIYKLKATKQELLDYGFTYRKHYDNYFLINKNIIEVVELDE